MSELTLARIERIDRARLSRQRERTHKQSRKLDEIFVMMVLGCASLIMFVVLAIHSKFEPGDQEQIAREYRATRHDAVEVAWK